MTKAGALSDADAAFEAARRLHEAGQLDQAKLAYEKILMQAPEHADSLHLLGVAAHQSGDHVRASALIQQAINVATGPVRAVYYNNIGSAFRASGRHTQAMISFGVSIRIDPSYAPAYFNLGVALSDEGNWEVALQRFATALRLNPELADAHYNKAIAEKQLYRTEESLASFREVLRLQPDNGLAQHYVALLTGTASDRAPDDYIVSVFDGSAEHFDEHLVEELQYDTPQLLVDMLQQHAHAGEKAWAVLDIGCGTGLVGAAIAPFAHCLAGVDLSARMLEKARQRKLYDRLEQSELLAMMKKEADASYDVITSADVFIYIGRLEGVFEQARRLLKPDAYFAFSAESLDDLLEEDAGTGEDYRLNPSGRYAHAAAYLRRLAATHDFEVRSMFSTPARLERGYPVLAWLALCQRRQ
ncbi:tetratricopeptide repeat protein [Undibacterium sp. TJN25]|uniref:tetratricopeptide repeat protein n=1 Tax=Undibacterium sp. TJN25 TaxID=3413056 RepID=UPI003BEF572B